MVNYGRSGACETCKQRRKKCDETRPHCKRCTASGRICPGYKNDSTIQFRHYVNLGDEEYIKNYKVALQEPLEFNTSGESVSVNDGQFENEALSHFFRDFCVLSSDRSISAGFLDGLPSFIERIGHSSGVATAAKIVALASFNNTSPKSGLSRRISELYIQLLRVLKDMISDGTNKAESLVIAILLGLYELVTCSQDYPGYHEAHVRGVSAILSSEFSAIEIHLNADSFPATNKLEPTNSLKDSYVPRVLLESFPNSPTASQIASLDAILVKFNPLNRRAREMFQGQYHSLNDVSDLKDRFLKILDEFLEWDVRQPEILRPKTEFIVSEEQAQRFPQYCSPGPIHSYYDLYVASIWNTYRKTCMLGLDVVMKASKILGEADVIEYETTFRKLGRDIISSIPFHLYKDLGQYALYLHGKRQLPDIGQPVGGLLLVHALYVILRIYASAEEHRIFGVHSLDLISSEMGIGIASVMSAGSKESAAWLPTDYIIKGHNLLWAAMLLRPF